jgi:4-amino-4-deoxy-L-arabinose transferase-like glycosyltransferase
MMSSTKTVPSQPSWLSDSRRILIVALASLLLLAQAVPLLYTRWVADESWYTAPADSLARHGELRVPVFAETALQARVETASPVLFVIMAGVFKLLGTGLYTAKLPYLLCAAAGIFLTYLLGCELESALLGVVAAVFLAADNMYFLAARTARPEAMVVFFSLCGILLFLYARRRRSVGLAFLSGLMVGVGALVHVNALSAGITAGVLALIEFRASIFRRARPWAFVAGLILPIIPFLLWATSDAVHREEFVRLYTTGEQYTLSQIPSLELSRYSDFIGMPNSRFRFPIPLPYRLHVVVALLAAAWFLRRYNRSLFHKVLCLLLPCMLWWVYVRNQNVRYTATAAPYFALLLAGAVIALWNSRPAWRRQVVAVAVLLLVAEVASNYFLLYLYRKSDYLALAGRFHALIPKDATVYGALTFWMAFHGQPFYSYSRTPLQYALDHGASYLVLNDNLMLHGNGWGIDDWKKVRSDTAAFVREHATLVGRAANPYYGDMEIYRVNHPAPPPHR